MSTTTDLVCRLRIKAAMIRTGERIEPFSECDLMEEAAQELEDWLESNKREIEAAREMREELAQVRCWGAI